MAGDLVLPSTRDQMQRMPLGKWKGTGKVKWKGTGKVVGARDRTAGCPTRGRTPHHTTPHQDPPEIQDRERERERERAVSMVRWSQEQ